MVFKIEDTNKEREINEQMVKKKLTGITFNNIVWFIVGWMIGIAMSLIAGVMRGEIKWHT